MENDNNNNESLSRDIRDEIFDVSDSETEGQEAVRSVGIVQSWKVPIKEFENEPDEIKRLSKIVKSNTNALEVSILLCHLYMCVTAAWSNNLNLVGSNQQAS